MFWYLALWWINLRVLLNEILFVVINPRPRADVSIEKSHNSQTIQHIRCKYNLKYSTFIVSTEEDGKYNQFFFLVYFADFVNLQRENLTLQNGFTAFRCFRYYTLFIINNCTIIWLVRDLGQLSVVNFCQLAVVWNKICSIVRFLLLIIIFIFFSLLIFCRFFFGFRWLNASSIQYFWIFNLIVVVVFLTKMSVTWIASCYMYSCWM